MCQSLSAIFTGQSGATYDDLSDVLKVLLRLVLDAALVTGAALFSSWKSCLSLNLLLGINFRPVRLVFTPGAFLTLITIKSSAPSL